MKRTTITAVLSTLTMLTATAYDNHTVQQQLPTALDGSRTVTAVPKVPEDSTEERQIIHVEFMGKPLSCTPAEMATAMARQGIDVGATDTVRHELRLAAAAIGDTEVDITISCDQTFSKINHIRLATPREDSRYWREDYKNLTEWLRAEYGEPDWEGTVRGHSFARWFVDFDHDIVIVTTGQETVEVYFYENHQQRNIDYYSILKFCEKNPADGVPLLTAAESITWQRTAPATVRKHVAKRNTRRTALRKKKAVRRKVVRRKSRRRR